MSASEAPVPRPPGDSRPGPRTDRRDAPAAALACTLVGPNPRGAVRRVSLAVRAFLRPRIDEGDALVLVAVSGGADSLALAVAAIDQCARAGVPVHTLTVDHGLREGSAQEADHVVAQMEALGAQSHLATVDVGGGVGGPESSARDARREALGALAAGLRAKSGRHRVLVLLGHTMDDQAETVLLRLARGSGAGSLRAMAPEVGGDDDVVWARPLLGVRRADTRSACAQLRLEWVEDPSNAPDGPWRAGDGSALRRAAVRAGALPALAGALGEDPVPALARTAHLLALDDDALEAEASRVLAGALLPVREDRPTQWEGQGWRTRTGPTAPTGRSVPAGREAPALQPDPSGDVLGATGTAPRALALDVRALRDCGAAVRTRVLHAGLLRAGVRPGDLSATHVEAVDALVTHWHGQGTLDLPGVSARRSTREGVPVLLIAAAPGA